MIGKLEPIKNIPYEFTLTLSEQEVRDLRHAVGASECQSLNIQNIYSLSIGNAHVCEEIFHKFFGTLASAVDQLDQLNQKKKTLS